MNFVPCTPGDAFVIDAGTPHAIGPGLTLLEPQHVAPGRRGLTYRFWDWNRRYDAQGRPDTTGTPRQLHVERSLAVTRWDLPGGAAFVDACRAEARALTHAAVGVQRVIDWRWFQVDCISGSGSTRLETRDRLLALTCVGGSASIGHADGELPLRCGESAVIPAAATAVDLRLQQATLYVTHSPSD